MTPTATKILTADDFLRLPDPPEGRNHELVRGEVVVMPRPGFRHGRIQGTIFSLLSNYGKTSGSGRAAVGVGIIIERDPDTVRGPDVAYWSFERMPRDKEPIGFAAISPELCVEVLSPTNRRATLTEKIGEYFEIGVLMVWVVDPEERTLTVYRSPEDDEARLFHEPARFADEDVLPGFSCQVAELFA